MLQTELPITFAEESSFDIDNEDLDTDEEE